MCHYRWDSPVLHHEAMYLPDGLNAFDELTYRTGRVARAEVLLQYANEQLFFELVGRDSRAVDALSSKSHSSFLAANRRMMRRVEFDHELRAIAHRLFKRSQEAITLRDKVVHGAFVLLEEKGTVMRINSEDERDLRWSNDRFDEAHDALRRARTATGALEAIVAGETGLSLRLIADDMFALYGNNSAMASTPQGRRTDPETLQI